MNDKKQIEEKAIEEMASIIQSVAERHHGIWCKELAKIIYNAGYRKQSEEKKPKGCEYCKGRAYTKSPLTVITKYGRRIELVFEFCPNCGRKMKGGAE